ncbi:MAG: hypothetical protein WBN88_11715 [Anderseniella sp.]
MPVDHLSFVASGTASVIVGGKTIATSEAGMANHLRSKPVSMSETASQTEVPASAKSAAA